MAARDRRSRRDERLETDQEQVAALRARIFAMSL
jgi:hypothetical protein